MHSCLVEGRESDRRRTGRERTLFDNDEKMMQGRQGYVLGSGELEFQASSSQGHCPANRLSSCIPKRNRAEGGGWTGSCDPWKRTFVGESSQMIEAQGVQRIKRQNCGSMVQGHWNTMNVMYGNQAQAGLGSRMNQEIEGRIGQCPGPMFINVEPVSMNDGAMVEDRVGIWNPVLASHSARSTHLSTMASYRNTDGQEPLGRSGREYNGCLEASFLSNNTYREHTALDHRPRLDPYMCTYLIPLSEGGNGRFPIEGSVSSPNVRSNLHAGTSGGRNKRKIPMAGMVGSSHLRAPHSFGRQNSNDVSSIDGSGPSTSDIGNLRCAHADVFPSTVTAPMIPVWDASRDIAFPCPRESSNRYICGRPLYVQQEQGRSQLHPSFIQDSQTSLATMPSQLMSRRMLTNEQVVESAANIFNSVVPDVENQSSFLTYNASNSSSVAQTYHSTSIGPVRQVTAGIFEGNQMGDLSNGASSWNGIADAHSCLPNHITSNSADIATPSRTSRALGTRAFHSHVSYTGAHPFVYPGQCVYPGSVASRSSAHISILPSSRRNNLSHQGRLLPFGASSASNNMMRVPQAVPADAYPLSASIHTPCPPGTSLGIVRPSESGQASSMQNLLFMPYQELQILPAGGGNRQHFVSEELLDRSLVYNGLDVPDQHSGMRLDVDNMSYEELLALEERIGTVNTGLSDHTMSKCLKESKYCPSNITAATVSQESEIKCSICQEEYMEEDELAKLNCIHSYHTTCIKQWLMQKNQCPICKAPAYSES